MKTLLKLILISIVLLQLSCNKENDELNVSGVWVHAETKADTIDFNSKIFTSEKTFELKRGREVHDGYELPKIGSGPYLYEIKGDSIYLRHVASSYGGYLSYYFKMDPDRRSFEIASFAPFTGGLMVNKFKRIDERSR